MFSLLFAAISVASHPSADVVVNATGPGVHYSAGFAIAGSPYACGGRYLSAASRASSTPATVRVAAPEGEHYVYLSWVRHPQGARDVAVRVGDVQRKLDQSRLANGAAPDALPHDDMADDQGLCSSGLFRLTDRPVRLKRGDFVEVVRSDGAPGTFTTLETVVFSPHLYLDDLGNDATWTGKPQINLKDYGREFSGNVGFGLAFIKPDQPDAMIEWRVPVAGPMLLSVEPSRGPSRAQAIPLEIQCPGGNAKPISLAGKGPRFGRAEWQDVAVFRNAEGARIRLRAAKDGVACADLLRLTPLAQADLVGPGEDRWERFTLQWEKPCAERPWLRTVKVSPASDTRVEVAPLKPSPNVPNGLEVRVARRIPAADATDGSGLLAPAAGSFRVELADDYGFTLSAEMLRRQPFVWLRDLGIFVCKDGDLASKKPQLDALAAQVEAAKKKPFLSTSEKYYQWTGYPETRPKLDDRAFEFAYAAPRPPAPRVSESIASMPEVNYAYFLKRVEDPKHRRMFLGWPNVCQEFYVLSNGAVGVSSGSGVGTGHPPAQHFTVQLGLGDPPVFKEHGDPSVAQRIEDGYHIIVHTQWSAGGAAIGSTAFAYPLAGEEVHTGNEPLAAYVRLTRTTQERRPLWLAIRPEHWGGPRNPLAKLATARIDQSRLVAGDRTVLGFASAKAAVHSASDAEVLVRLEPDRETVDLVIPYIAVDKDLVAKALATGFAEALSRTKKYWDNRLATGATIDTPDPVVNNLYKTLYPRTLVCADLDVQGDYALKTSPIIYDRVWLHATAYGIEGLARRGHFREARQYLEAAFRWQGSQASDSRSYTTWKGFFNAPPRYTALLWINYHGWMQWAAARYFLFSGDTAWLQEKLPALIASLEWTASQRRLTMRTNPDGTRPLNYGWLPPGRVTDGSAGTSTFSDCINWMGFHELTGLLERIGHPRAAEFRAVADDYRACILRGMRRAAALREPVRLNDGTYVPYVPGYLESTGREETMWYAAVVDGGLEGILDSGIIPPGDPMEDWVLHNLEDNLFVIAPNLADEAYFLGHGCGYVRRDQPEQAIYTFYSVIASNMSRQTLTTFEHRSWGAGRVYDLTPWPMGYYTRMLAGMLCADEGSELTYCKATPRAWLDPGKQVRVERLQTRFGPTSFTLTAQQHRIQGILELPRRQPPAAARLRLRVNGRITSVKLNDRLVEFDSGTSCIPLPASAERIKLEANVER